MAALMSNDSKPRSITHMAERKKTRRGILAGGNWIIDLVKMIDVYPQRDSLANIATQSQGTGGSPYNILVELATERLVPLQATADPLVEGQLSTHGDSGDEKKLSSLQQGQGPVDDRIVGIEMG